MRTSISIADDVAALSEEIMKRERRRDFSSLCEIALLEYCQARGPQGHEAELISAAKEVGMPKALAAVRRAARKR